MYKHNRAFVISVHLAYYQYYQLMKEHFLSQRHVLALAKRRVSAVRQPSNDSLVH